MLCILTSLYSLSSYLFLLPTLSLFIFIRNYFLKLFLDPSCYYLSVSYDWANFITFA